MLKNIVCIVSDPNINKILEPLKESSNLTIYNKKGLSPEELIDLAKDANILITAPSSIKPLDRNIIESIPNLEHISLLTIGTDWIDLEYTKEQGIKVSNIGDATAESVAEHTWAMILDLSKRVSEFDRAARLEGKYNFAEFKGKEVFGKTLGVLGLGNIGKRVAHIGEIFSMNILGVHTTMDPVDGITIVDKETLLKESDIIAVCLPLNSSTKDYISTQEISLMKDCVIVVNPAREEIVNKDAVLDGIEIGKIYGYGIETPIMKQIPSDDPYYNYPNIIVTPHNAFNTIDADKRTYEIIRDNVVSYLEGNPPNLVS